jgi:hypothetical protein
VKDGVISHVTAQALFANISKRCWQVLKLCARAEFIAFAIQKEVKASQPTIEMNILEKNAKISSIFRMFS